MIVVGRILVGGRRELVRAAARAAARRPPPPAAVAAGVRAYLALSREPLPEECPGIYAAVERALTAALKVMGEDHG